MENRDEKLENFVFRDISIKILKKISEKVEPEIKEIKKLEKELKKEDRGKKKEIKKRIKELKAEISKGYRPKELNPGLWPSKVFYEGINQLKNLKIICENKMGDYRSAPTYYSPSPDYFIRASKIASKVGRRNTDIDNIQSFKFSNVIGLNSPKGEKTTLYGLLEDVFHKTDEGEKARLFDFSQKETVDFQFGVETKEVVGKYFGMPLDIEIRAQREKSNEKEIIDKQRNHYLNLVKKGMRIVRKSNPREDKKTRKKGKIIRVDEEVIKDVIENIIKRHRNHKLNYEELGENISNHLLNLKKEHRKKKILEAFELKLKAFKKGRIKYNLNRFKDGFVGILSHTDIDSHFLDRAVFEWYGEGCGGYSPNKEFEKYKKFRKFLESLNKREENKIFQFLRDVFNENLDLYPTRVAFVCRGHSSDKQPSRKRNISFNI